MSVYLLTYLLGKAYQWENCLTITNCTCRHLVSKDLVRKPSFPVTLTNSGSWESFLMSRPYWLSRPWGWQWETCHSVLSACTVNRCKTVFSLVGPAKFLDNVSKTLIVKNQAVIDCLQLLDTNRHAMTQNDVFSEKLHFHFFGEYSKLDRVRTENDGYTWTS